jgi:hypothetical protein
MVFFYIRLRINVGCLHPVWCVRSGDRVLLYASWQRHYHRLILLLILLNVSVERPSSVRKYIISYFY